MDKTIIPLFSTPIYTSLLKDIPEQEKQYIYNSEYRRAIPDNGDLSVDRNLLEDKNCSTIKKLILKEIKEFVGALKVDPKTKFVIKNSWAVKHHPLDFSHTHFHSNSLLSGVLYLKVDKTSGDIFFRKGMPSSGFGYASIRLEYTELNLLNMDYFSIKPVENQLILFPSTLQHDVEVNNSSIDRYVLAFNVFPVGKIGDKESTDELKL